MGSLPSANGPTWSCSVLRSHDHGPLAALAQGLRRRFPEDAAIAPGEAPQLEEAMRHGDVGDGGALWIGGAQRVVRRAEPLTDGVLLGTETQHVVERGAQGALADTSGPA